VVDLPGLPDRGLPIEGGLPIVGLDLCGQPVEVTRHGRPRQGPQSSEEIAITLGLTGSNRDSYRDVFSKLCLVPTQYRPMLRSIQVEFEDNPVRSFGEGAAFAGKEGTESPVGRTVTDLYLMAQLLEESTIDRLEPFREIEEYVTIGHIHLLDTSLIFVRQVPKRRRSQIVISPS
jgi:hypothetical protein